MTLSPGARLGPYEILSALGAGGMGEVYRARDTRLDRTVAIKVLPSHLSASPEARQRFEREAKTISSLSHPHICALYDVGNQDGVEYLVMEYLEGETLAERLSRTEAALPLPQVLRFGVEIADALDRAHRQGIVHRDLKPGNVMLTKSGVKLLDFGLAKAMAPVTPPSGATALPTVGGNAPLTQEGTILGTFQYMAPEQLEGKDADARTDLFAFGAVLYEMTTGKRAFSGSSQASLISAIMREEPAPISTVAPMSPPALDRVVRTCLAKDAEDRWQSAHDVASELRWISEEGSRTGVPTPVVSRRKSRERLTMAAAAAGFLAAALLALLWVRDRSRAPGAPSIHALIAVPEQANYPEVAVPELSPDGTTLVWSGSDAGFGESTSSLWVRSLANDDAHPLAGTDRAVFAFWSPDGRSIGFFADRKLKRIELAGGAPVTLCDISDVARGGSWNRDGVIIFPGTRSGPLFRISAAGGAPEPLTKLDAARGDTTHRWPQFLPDGRHFLYLASANVSEKHAVFVGSLDGRENRLLALASSSAAPVSEAGHPLRTEAVANAAYASGQIFYVEKSALCARPFDADKLQITGPARVVAENVGSGYGMIRSMFSLSQKGDLVFVSEPSSSKSHIEWIDRENRRSAAVPGSAIYATPRFSPNGSRMVVVIEDPRTHLSDIWTTDTAGVSRTRLTFGAGSSETPVWSPDATRIAYAATRSKFGIFEKASSGVGPEKLIRETPGVARVTSWSPDGRFLLYDLWSGTQGTGYDVWALPLAPPGEPIPVLRKPGDESEATFSPDGKYVAYTWTESGHDEIYVQTFPAGDGKWQISNEGGSLPRWSRDGREIFFIDPKRRIFAAAVQTAGVFTAGAPRLVAETPSTLSDYEASPDGNRFLIVSPVVDPAHLPLHLIANWPAALKR
ncbi:MAG: protein kinase [Acidobacteriota bacterium]|nr:protein kinase [Acidobacteriota bacterium]